MSKIHNSGSVIQRPWVDMLPWFTCLMGLLIQYHLMIFSGFRYMHRGLGDARLVNFTLEHGYRWLRQVAPHEDFWKAPIFFPYPTASAFTDTQLGFAPPYWLARLLGAAPDTALQWWILTIYVLNFCAAYALLRRGTKLSKPVSSAGALLLVTISIAWSPHLQLLPFFYMLTALLALFRIFDPGENAPGTTTRRVWIAVFFACFVLQLWAAVYAFFFFGLLTAMAIIVALTLSASRRVSIRRIRRDAGVWILLAALSAAAVMPLLQHYTATAEETSYRNYHEASIARPHSWIVMGGQDRAFGWLQKTGGPLPTHPRSLGIGLLTFSFAAAGLFTFRRRISVQLLSISTLALAALGTMYWGFSPWQWIHEWVPGADGIRAQYRITMIFVPAAVIGVALACHGALQRGRLVLAVLLFSLSLAERFHFRSMVDKNFIRGHVSGIAERIDTGYKAFILVSPGRECHWVSDDAAWVALATGVPTINGRYGNFPADYEIRHHDCYSKGDDPGRRELESALEDWLKPWGIERSEIQWIEYQSLSRESTKNVRSQ